jgi:hypothetical protein
MKNRVAHVSWHISINEKLKGCQVLAAKIFLLPLSCAFVFISLSQVPALFCVYLALLQKRFVGVDKTAFVEVGAVPSLLLAAKNNCLQGRVTP